MNLEAVRPGVYDYWRGTDRFRVVVAGELAQEPHNARLHVFSAAQEQIGYGLGHFRLRSLLTSSVLYQLFRGYEVGGIEMPYTLEDLDRDVREDILKRMSPEERLAGLSLKDCLKGLSPEERLEGLSREQIEACLAKLGDGGQQPAPQPPAKKVKSKRKP